MGDAGAAFSQAGLVPNVIPTPPTHKLDATYHKSIEVGEHLHPLDVRSAPKIVYNQEVLDGDFFTILMFDPDYPKREAPIDAAYIHWLIPNIPHDSMRRGQATGTRANVGYMPPTPIPNSGQHRLVILLFYHPKRKINQPTIKQRSKFNVKEFMTKHNFTAPVAGTFFVTENDS